MDCQVVEPGLEVQVEAVSEGLVPQGTAQCCPIVHLEIVVAETLVEAPEVVDDDEPQAFILLGLPEDGYPILGWSSVSPSGGGEPLLLVHIG